RAAPARRPTQEEEALLTVAGAERGGGGRQAAQVAAGILLTRVLGYVRERVTAYYLGNGAAADAVRIALRVPNAIRNLLGEGTLSASFIPVYAALNERPDKAAARALAGAGAGRHLAREPRAAPGRAAGAPRAGPRMGHGGGRRPAGRSTAPRLLAAAPRHRLTGQHGAGGRAGRARRLGAARAGRRRRSAVVPRGHVPGLARRGGRGVEPRVRPAHPGAPDQPVRDLGRGRLTPGALARRGRLHAERPAAGPDRAGVPTDRVLRSAVVLRIRGAGAGAGGGAVPDGPVRTGRHAHGGRRLGRVRGRPGGPGNGAALRHRGRRAPG